MPHPPADPQGTQGTIPAGQPPSGSAANQQMSTVQMNYERTLTMQAEAAPAQSSFVSKEPAAGGLAAGPAAGSSIAEKYWQLQQAEE